MPQGRDAGVGEEAVLLRDAVETLGEHDVVVEHHQTFREALFQPRVEGPDVIEAAVEHGLARARGLGLGAGEEGRDVRARAGVETPRRGGRVERFEIGLEVRLDGQLGAEDLLQLPRVAVHLDHGLAGEQLAVPDVAGAFVERGAQHQDQVGVFPEIAQRLTGGGDTQAAQGQGRSFVHRSLALQAGGHGNAQAPAQAGQRRARTRADAAMAGDDHGLARTGEQIETAFHVGRRGQAWAAVPGEGDPIQQRGIHRLLLYVEGDAQHHRPGGVGQKTLGRLDQHVGQIVGAFDQPVITGDAGEQRDLIDAAALTRAFLQAALAEHGGGRLARDGQHRQAVHVGAGNGRDQVGGAGPGGGDAGADAAGDAGVATSHERRRLLVPGQHGLDRGIVEGVVDRQDVGSRDAEDAPHAQAFQETHDEFADRYVHRG